MHRLLEMTETELFAAVERFMEKFRSPENGADFDEAETQWLKTLDRVHSKFRGKIGREPSFLLSWGQISVSLFSPDDDDDAAGDLEAACVKAHREALRPPREYERKHVFIDGGSEEDQPPDHMEPEDDAVIGALASLSPDDNALLREFYIGGRTAKDLAAEHGVTEDTIRQRIHRAKLRFKSKYKGTNDDDSRVPAHSGRHVTENGEDFPEFVGFSRDDPGRDSGHLRLYRTACG